MSELKNQTCKSLAAQKSDTIGGNRENAQVTRSNKVMTMKRGHICLATTRAITGEIWNSVISRSGSLQCQSFDCKWTPQQSMLINVMTYPQIDLSEATPCVIQIIRPARRAVTGRQCPHSGVGEDFLVRWPGGSFVLHLVARVKTPPKSSKFWQFCTTPPVGILLGLRSK